MDNTPKPEQSKYSKILQKEAYTPDEAAYLLGIDHDVLYQAVHRGHLNALMIGEDIVSIDRGDLVKWLETR